MENEYIVIGGEEGEYSYLCSDIDEVKEYIGDMIRDQTNEDTIRVFKVIQELDVDIKLLINVKEE